MTAVEFAIKMELDGMKFYSELAEKNKGNKLDVVFTLLADEEKKHADIIKKHAGASDVSMKDNPELSKVGNVFSDIEYGSNPEMKVYISQADGYREARQKEKESVELYEKLLLETSDAKEKELFSYLVGQEKEHLTLMDSLVELVDKLNKTASAEFGLTDDY